MLTGWAKSRTALKMLTNEIIQVNCKSKFQSKSEKFLRRTKLQNIDNSMEKMK
jgi:hypothetical protein